MNNQSVVTEEIKTTAELVLSIVVPVEGGNGVDFGPLITAVEKAIADAWPGAVVTDVPTKVE